MYTGIAQPIALQIHRKDTRPGDLDRRRRRRVPDEPQRLPQPGAPYHPVARRRVRPDHRRRQPAPRLAGKAAVPQGQGDEGGVRSERRREGADSGGVASQGNMSKSQGLELRCPLLLFVLLLVVVVSPERAR